MSEIDCRNCPIDDWIHGCHLTVDECITVTDILEASLDRITKEYFKEHLTTHSPSLDGYTKNEDNNGKNRER